MNNDYYFSEVVNEDTWEDFIEHYNKADLSKFYKKITGYGWKDVFGFNYNGEALYVNKHGLKYKGVWFVIGDTRIGIFEFE